MTKCLQLNDNHRFMLFQYQMVAVWLVHGKHNASRVCETKGKTRPIEKQSKILNYELTFTIIGSNKWGLQKGC
jgi:hypothetical protein